MPEALLAQIALSGVPYAADRLYTYEVLPELRERIAPGMRVIVPFGRGNRRVEGMVLALSDAAADKQLKPVLSVTDEEPLPGDGLLRLVRWMKARYFCTYYDAIRAILPGGLWLRYREVYRLADGAAPTDELTAWIAQKKKAEKEKLHEVFGEAVDLRLRELTDAGILTVTVETSRQVSDKTVKMVSLPQDCDAEGEHLTETRKAVLATLRAEGMLPLSDVCYLTGASPTTVRAMEKAGLVVFSEQEILRVPTYLNEKAEPITLNDEQQAAFDGISARMQSPSPRPALLYGVTASGKTQVYLRLIEQTLAAGRTAMLLVPEIALTPQMMAKFVARFGDRVAMLHSALRLTERCDQWKRIRRGEVRVVLGTRSAVFAPLRDLGLIIIDEEQEPTYRSENTPRYHAREVALQRCAQEGAFLLLGSATPTVETMYAAQSGRYEIFKLCRRYSEQSLPRVRIADLREELRRGGSAAISAPLREELERNIACGEQSILFLNRRGSARMLLCGECGAVPECPRCSVPMTYHSANGRLMCHYCGHSEAAAEKCTVCGGIRKHVGFGTQKVEEELQSIFPGVGVLRMDTDTVGASHPHEAVLRRFAEEKVPILLGTQMVAKGLDFENVTLVGVLAADLSLYVENYHAAERTFSLLTQVVGRAGRGSREGRAVIQTYTPENDVIRAAAAQDYAAFYEQEIRLRRLRRYPPFADLFTMTVSGADEDRVIRSAAALRDGLRADETLRQLQAEVLGPAGAPIVKMNNRFRYRVFVTAPETAALRRTLADFLHAFYLHRENRGLDLFVDCNALQ